MAANLETQAGQSVAEWAVVHFTAASVRYLWLDRARRSRRVATLTNTY